MKMEREKMSRSSQAAISEYDALSNRQGSGAVSSYIEAFPQLKVINSHACQVELLCERKITVY
jgi:hypothetical protein